jgi:hypothetical protein
MKPGATPMTDPFFIEGPAFNRHGAGVSAKAEDKTGATTEAARGEDCEGGA